MATATEQERGVERSIRWQVSLADLSVLVLAAGLAAGVVRGARDIQVEPGRVAGVGVEVAAVFLAVILLRSMLGVARQRPLGAGVTTAGRLASMAWRALAVVLLIHFVMLESGVLRVDLATRRSPPLWGKSSLSEWFDVREKLIPLCAILAMFGVAVGMGAGVILARPEPRRPRPYWLFVPLAALAAVLFVAGPGEHAVVPQFILIALEAVNNAMHPLSRVHSASLSARLLRAGIEAVPATLAIIGLALIVARDFQRAGRSMPWATTRVGWFVRVFALAAAGAAGIGMVLVAMPTMNPIWLDGFPRGAGSGSHRDHDRSDSGPSRRAWRPERSCRVRPGRSRDGCGGSRTCSRSDMMGIVVCLRAVMSPRVHGDRSGFAADLRSPGGWS